MNVYLDIDGVLLNKDLSPANHVHDFLKYVTDNHDVYWLTTHCKGDSTTAYNRLSTVFQPETMRLLTNVKATNWSTSKTEGIDFDQPFLWFDDNLFYGEKQALDERNVSDNWIQVDLIKNPEQLLSFVEDFPLPAQA